MSSVSKYNHVIVEKDRGLTWVTLNRPDKRNAMSPELDLEMLDIILSLEGDPETRVLILTGAGEAFCAGMDLKLYFRELENKPAERIRAEWVTHQWRWYRLWNFPKPTIAMVNGFCMGGAFTQLIACDFAFAAEDAKFGLSEVNWGILPGGLVSKVLQVCLGYRDALYCSLTGELFDGKKAEEIRLINKAVPAADLRKTTEEFARRFLKLNPETLRATKQGLKAVRDMDFGQAHEYLMAKTGELRARDKENGYSQGIKQFVDDKSFKPGLGAYKRPE
ncbi:MAG: p-hydroxycinnamoyl CoA hydratase/lyase [Xanthobacteraceae bacterium]